MKRSSSAIQLKQLFEEKLLPWSQAGALRWITAREHQKALHVPQNVEVRRRVMRGRSVAHRGPRQHRNASFISRLWPEDHLSSLKVPKLCCVISGRAVIELGEYEVEMPAGTFLFIPARIPQPHGTQGHLSPSSSEDCDVCWVSPHGEQLRFWICRSSKTKHFTLLWSDIYLHNRQLVQYFELLRNEVTSSQKESAPITSHLLALVLLEMQREVETEKFLLINNFNTSLPHAGPSQDPVAMAMQYMDTNFAEHITIESLARQVGLSRAVLARRFREQAGRTVVGYLTEKRLEYAANMLRHTEWTVTYIVRYVGLRSTAHFHTLFQKHFHCSPGEYRRRALLNKDDPEYLATIQSRRVVRHKG